MQFSSEYKNNYVKKPYLNHKQLNSIVKQSKYQDTLETLKFITAPYRSIKDKTTRDLIKSTTFFVYKHFNSKTPTYFSPYDYKHAAINIVDNISPIIVDPNPIYSKEIPQDLPFIKTQYIDIDHQIDIKEVKKLLNKIGIKDYLIQYNSYSGHYHLLYNFRPYFFTTSSIANVFINLSQNPKLTRLDYFPSTRLKKWLNSLKAAEFIATFIRSYIVFQLEADKSSIQNSKQKLLFNYPEKIYKNILVSKQNKTTLWKSFLKLISVLILDGEELERYINFLSNTIGNRSAIGKRLISFVSILHAVNLDKIKYKSISTKYVQVGKKIVAMNSPSRSTKNHAYTEIIETILLDKPFTTYYTKEPKQSKQLIPHIKQDNFKNSVQSIIEFLLTNEQYYYPGIRHNLILRLFSTAKRYGITKDEALYYATTYLSGKDEELSERVATIKYIYDHTGPLYGITELKEFCKNEYNLDISDFIVAKNSNPITKLESHKIYDIFKVYKHRSSDKLNLFILKSELVQLLYHIYKTKNKKEFILTNRDLYKYLETKNYPSLKSLRTGHSNRIKKAIESLAKENYLSYTIGKTKTYKHYLIHINNSLIRLYEENLTTFIFKNNIKLKHILFPSQPNRTLSRNLESLITIPNILYYLKHIDTQTTQLFKSSITYDRVYSHPFFATFLFYVSIFLFSFPNSIKHFDIQSNLPNQVKKSIITINNLKYLQLPLLPENLSLQLEEFLSQSMIPEVLIEKLSHQIPIYLSSGSEDTRFLRLQSIIKYLLENLSIDNLSRITKLTMIVLDSIFRDYMDTGRYSSYKPAITLKEWIPDITSIDEYEDFISVFLVGNKSLAYRWITTLSRLSYVDVSNYERETISFDGDRSSYAVPYYPYLQGRVLFAKYKQRIVDDTYAFLAYLYGLSGKNVYLKSLDLLYLIPGLYRYPNSNLLEYSYRMLRQRIERSYILYTSSNVTSELRSLVKRYLSYLSSTTITNRLVYPSSYRDLLYLEDLFVLFEQKSYSFISKFFYYDLDPAVFKRLVLKKSKVLRYFVHDSLFANLVRRQLNYYHSLGLGVFAGLDIFISFLFVSGYTTRDHFSIIYYTSTSYGRSVSLTYIWNKVERYFKYDYIVNYLLGYRDLNYNPINKFLKYNQQFKQAA